MNESVTQTFRQGSWPRPQYPIRQARREKTAPAHGVKVSALTTRRIGAAPRGDEGIIQKRQSNQLDHPAPPADFLFERADSSDPTARRLVGTPSPKLNTTRSSRNRRLRGPF
jgi:hypothetical protein